jgi:hypothetical protein
MSIAYVKSASRDLLFSGVEISTLYSALVGIYQTEWSLIIAC